MIMVLDPWRDPVVLRRVRCLFEVYRALALDATVYMRFSRSETARFYAKLRDTTYDSMKHSEDVLVPIIDAAKAEATFEKDRIMIHNLITESLGMDAFNAKVQQFLDTALRQAALKGAVRARQRLARRWVPRSRGSSMEGLVI
jgi:hypothetical protein